jgi:propanol-preferring alcohol dehydrogenase
MRAAVVISFDQPLEIKERPIPEPGPGQVQVRIEASGLCHTDIHAARRLDRQAHTAVRAGS